MVFDNRIRERISRCSHIVFMDNAVTYMNTLTPQSSELLKELIHSTPQQKWIVTNGDIKPLFRMLTFLRLHTEVKGVFQSSNLQKLREHLMGSTTGPNGLDQVNIMLIGVKGIDKQSDQYTNILFNQSVKNGYISVLINSNENLDFKYSDVVLYNLLEEELWSGLRKQVHVYGYQKLSSVEQVAKKIRIQLPITTELHTHPITSNTTTTSTTIQSTSPSNNNIQYSHHSKLHHDHSVIVGKHIAENLPSRLLGQQVFDKNELLLSSYIPTSPNNNTTTTITSTGGTGSSRVHIPNVRLSPLQFDVTSTISTPIEVNIYPPTVNTNSAGSNTLTPIIEEVNEQNKKKKKKRRIKRRKDSEEEGELSESNEKRNSKRKRRKKSGQQQEELLDLQAVREMRRRNVVGGNLQPIQSSNSNSPYYNNRHNDHFQNEFKYDLDDE